MNQDLQNYVNSARASGKSEQDIRSELSSAGWAEADIYEAFSAGVVNSTTGAVVAAGMSTKMILFIIIGLLVIGGGVGGYFVFSNNQKTPEIKVTNNTNTTQTKELKPWEDAVKGHFSCEDLFSPKDFAAVFNKLESDYKSRESSRFDYVLDCESTSTNEYFTFKIWWGNTGLSDIVITAWESQKQSAFNDVFKLGVKNISDIGSEAFSEGTYYEDGTHWDNISALSTDKEYIIHVSAGNTLKNKILAPTLEFDQLIDIAKIISNNLNKFPVSKKPETSKNLQRESYRFPFHCKDLYVMNEYENVEEYESFSQGVWCKFQIDSRDVYAFNVMGDYIPPEDEYNMWKNTFAIGLKPVEVSGIGAEAVSIGSSQLIFLSSNKKYTVRVTKTTLLYGGADKNELDTKILEMGQTIASKLNNY